ncbi:Ger(x)C family spore germination protein [Lederbergia lenta]|uniref:Ger(x)C family spore germination protein n=1 Tax=Lederbergia lenta TaxID=1467 RepID=UPI002040922B|nr:Ger(x)C family spore germination protein [Lederbergia lenta]MCM3112516.1 Ger(x)C family spore germination protein [Lederbergia lenta]
MASCLKRLILIISSLALFGCSDSRAPEHLSYTHGLGIDYKDGEYIIYIQLLNLGTLAKSESAGSGEDVVIEVGRARAKNVDEAIFHLYRSAEQEIYWGTLSYIILSENLLREEGLNSVIDMWSRYPETRYQISLYIINKEIEKAMLTSPVTDVSKGLNKIARPENSQKQNNFVPFINLRQLLILLDEPNHLGVIPHISVSEHSWKQTKNTPRPLIEIDGISLYDRDEQLLGNLIGKEAQGFRWVTKEFSRSDLILQKNNQPLAALIVNNIKTKIIPIVKDGKVTFQLNIKADTSVSELNLQAPLQELEEKAAKEIKEQVLFTYLEALKLDADIYRLSEKLYRSDLPSWKKHSENGKLELKEESLEIEVEVLIKDALRNHLKRSVK